MKNLKEITITTATTVVLILIIAFCICSTAFGQSRGRRQVQVQEQYYHALEQEYIREIHELLEERGYCNSGVTMNRVIQEDGSRQYIVTIHHRRIAKLNQNQQKELLNECGMIDFPVEDCKFFHEFLETDL
ncbi:MAG: hypothetical protein HDQ97_17530 [Lachnospiraceae bacterium]|nr:hypothetical protein [Lachnospiraceae bacterium]